MNIVEIDLTDPGIHFMLSPATPPAPNPTVYETSGQTTLAFITQQNAQLGINVHFFDFPLAANGGTKTSPASPPPTATSTPPSTPHPC